MAKSIVDVPHKRDEIARTSVAQNLQKAYKHLVLAMQNVELCIYHNVEILPVALENGKLIEDKKEMISFIEDCAEGIARISMVFESDNGVLGEAPNENQTEIQVDIEHEVARAKNTTQKIINENYGGSLTVVNGN